MVGKNNHKYISMKKSLNLLILIAVAQLCNAQEKIVPIKFGDMEHWTVRYIKESKLLGGQIKTLYVLAPTDTIRKNAPFNFSNTCWGISNAYAAPAGIELRWEGEGINEKGIVVSVSGSVNSDLVGRTVVAVSEDFYRPTDVVNLWGDPTKAKAKLGWNPQTTTFEQLVELMVKHDMAKVAADNAASDVRKMNLAEYLEKGIVK